MKGGDPLPRESVAMSRNVERHLNWLLAMVHPRLYKNACSVQEWLRSSNSEEMKHISTIWESLFPCIAVISNSKTPTHRDSHGIIDYYDLLLSIGNAEDLVLELPELQLKLSYPPGTVVFICGRGLAHKVPAWNKEMERCCWAHFIRETHIDSIKPQLPKSGWSYQADFGVSN